MNAKEVIPVSKKIKEEWMPVSRKGLRYQYQVSNKGNVRKLNNDGSVNMNLKNWIVVNSETGQKDCCVMLEYTNSFESTSVAELVACAFMGANPGCVVDHVNNHVSVNTVGNLKVVKDGKPLNPSSSKCFNELTGEVYSSLRNAAQRTGLSRDRITRMCKQGKGEYNGYRIRFMTS